jgi:hypothetical protein
MQQIIYKLRSARMMTLLAVSVFIGLLCDIEYYAKQTTKKSATLMAYPIAAIFTLFFMLSLPISINTKK